MTMSRTVLVAIVCLFAHGVPAAEEVYQDESVWVADTPGMELQLEEVSVPTLPTGPGFRRLNRFLLGGFIQEDEEFQDNLTSTNPVYYTEIGVKERVRLGSLGFSRFYLWDWQLGALDTPAGWRIDYDLTGIAGEFGMLPVAAMDPLSEQNCTDTSGWFSGIQQVNYFGYGVKWYNGSDQFETDGLTNLVGRVFTETHARNTLVGPQLLIGRTLSKRRWLLDLSGSVVCGYSGVSMRQHTGYGVSVPGSMTSSSLVSTVPSEYHNYKISKQSVGGLAEVRLASSYLIRKNWTLDVIARAFTTGPWYESEKHLVYLAPEYGLTDAHASQIYGGNLYLGFSYLK